MPYHKTRPRIPTGLYIDTRIVTRAEAPRGQGDGGGVLATCTRQGPLKRLEISPKKLYHDACGARHHTMRVLGPWDGWVAPMVIRCMTGVCACPIASGAIQRAAATRRGLNSGTIETNRPLLIQKISGLVIARVPSTGYNVPAWPYHSTYDSAMGCIESLALARLPFGPAFRDERHPRNVTKEITHHPSCGVLLPWPFAQIALAVLAY